MGIPTLQSMVDFISRATKKLKNNYFTGSTTDQDDNHKGTGRKKTIIPTLTPPMTPARVFIRKASRIAFFSKKKSSTGTSSDEEVVKEGEEAVWKTPARVFIRKASRIAFFSKKKSSTGTSSDEEVVKEGEEAVWKRTILMGEKCEPLDFTGVIYYDSEGKRLDGVPPKSPRHPMGELVSQLPSFASPARILNGTVSTGRAW